MRSASKCGLLEIAAQAIDAKCRRDDHFEVMRLCELMEGHHHASDNMEKLITMLLIDEDQEAITYRQLLKALESEVSD